MVFPKTFWLVIKVRLLEKKIYSEGADLFKVEQKGAHLHV